MKRAENNTHKGLSYGPLGNLLTKQTIFSM